jgi:MOSC domain-containing protein YiiM
MFRSTAELEADLSEVAAAPRERGHVVALVARPRADERAELDRARLEPAQGLVGDRWAARFAGGTDDPAEQATSLTLMNSRAAGLLAATRDRWALAGDQLYVDFHLGEENLRPGERVRCGGAVLEITSKPHLGCKKFAARFGPDALAFVNSPQGKHLRLRGLYARVVSAGDVAAGDVIEKLSA